jgi:hypothetical protein
MRVPVAKYAYTTANTDRKNTVRDKTNFRENFEQIRQKKGNIFRLQDRKRERNVYKFFTSTLRQG